jgi:hypothetical protein
MRNAVIEILNADDDDIAVGAAINVGQVVSASFQIICSDADLDGTLKIQMSNDGTQMPFTPTNWSDIPNASSTITNGVGDPIVIYQMCFQYIRASLGTPGTPGSGTISVKMNTVGV